MPDLTEKQLDVALSDLENAGYGDEPEVLGGGIFGVVVESNWTVCAQEPAAGEPVDGTPRLTVDRSCEDLNDPEDGASDIPAPSPTEAAPAATDEEIWAANYEETQDAYAAQVAAALGLSKVRGLGADDPLESCGLIKKNLSIGPRTSKAAAAIDLRRAPTAAQIFDVISAATTYLCPELENRH